MVHVFCTNLVTILQQIGDESNEIHDTDKTKGPEVGNFTDESLNTGGWSEHAKVIYD